MSAGRGGLDGVVPDAGRVGVPGSPPATIAEFGSWIALSQSRREIGRAACYTLLTGKDEVSGLFMALRMERWTAPRLGFALNPQLWGTGVFIKVMNLYLDFLFNEWGVTTSDR